MAIGRRSDDDFGCHVAAGEAPSQTVLAGGALVIGALVVNEVIGWRQRI